MTASMADGIASEAKVLPIKLTSYAVPELNLFDSPFFSALRS